MARHDDLMAEAMAKTGLRDFGDDSFREGLEILSEDDLEGPEDLKP